MTADLIDFLRARLDDDERIARAAVEESPDDSGEWRYDGFDYVVDAKDFPRAGNSDYPPDTETLRHIARHDPARVLREVAAKRRLLDYAEGGTCGFSDNGGCLHCDYLGILAAVYADHPDYRTEWGE